jgi:hypothetical protein
MYKKLITACMAVAAFAAFVIPATASANPDLTEGGVLVPTATNIVGTNVGETIMTTSLGKVICTNVVLKGTLTVNSTEKGIEGDINSATFAGEGETAPGEPDKECTSWAGGVSVTPNPATNGLPWCVEATENSDTIKLRGGSCTSATRPIRFTLVFTSGLIGTCTYQRTNAAVGTIDTVNSTAGILDQEWTRFEGGAGCPSVGKLDMTFKLETENGTALTIGS